MQASLGYFAVLDRLKKAGLRVEPLTDGSLLVLRPEVMIGVIRRPPGKLPNYDPAGVDLVIKTFAEFADPCKVQGVLPFESANLKLNSERERTNR